MVCLGANRNQPLPIGASLNKQMIPPPEQNDAGGHLLSQREVAKALKVHPLTVSRWTTARIIPCHRIGRVIRYDLTAVLAAIQKTAKKKGGDK